MPIFISYSSTDRDFAVRLASDLVKVGHEVWLDVWKITGRIPYWDEIQAGIEGCSHLLFLISPDSLAENSGARDELYHASGLKPRPIFIPVMVREYPYNKLPIVISAGRYQIQDFTRQSYDSALSNILTALDAKHVTAENREIPYSPLPTESHQSTPSRVFSHPEPVRCAVFSPDSTMIATGCDDNVVRLWSIATGIKTRQFNGHTDYVRSVAFLSEGMSLVSASDDGTTRLWNIKRGAETKKFEGPAKMIWSAAISPTGNAIATAGGTSVTIRRTDIDSIIEFKGHTRSVSSVAFSPEGKYILTASWDKTARLWNATSGREIARFPHDKGVTNATFSPDGKKILTGSDEYIARIWDIVSGQELRRFTGHTLSVFSVAFSPDGKFVLTGSWDQTARLWDAATGTELRRFKGHTHRIHSVAFSFDGKHILTSGEDGTVCLWNSELGNS